MKSFQILYPERRTASAYMLSHSMRGGFFLYTFQNNQSPAPNTFFYIQMDYTHYQYRARTSKK